MKKSLILGLVLACGFSGIAKADLTDYLQPTDNYKYTFAVYDIRPASFPAADLEKILTTAIRTYANKANVSHSIPPQTLTTGAPRMILQKVARGGMETYNPVCIGEILSITAIDTDMARYGEITGSKTCVFQYKDGYRVNYYGQFLKQTGGVDPDIIGATLGRLFTKAIGLGDSSRFIKSTLDKFEANLKDVGADVKIVELFPAMDGKVVVADPAPKLDQVEQASLSSQNSYPNAAPMVSPPTLEQLQTVIANNPKLADIPAIQKMLAQAQQRKLDESQAGLQAEPSINPELQARKDLSGMGLSYFNQQQFVDAIKRGDKMAVKLFLKADAIDVNALGADGKSPLMLANRPDIAELIKSHAAH
jgi:hypothetical protein